MTKKISHTRKKATLYKMLKKTLPESSPHYFNKTWFVPFTLFVKKGSKVLLPGWIGQVSRGDRDQASNAVS